MKFYEQQVTEIQLFSYQQEALISGNLDSRSISFSLQSVLDESIQTTLYCKKMFFFVMVKRNKSLQIVVNFAVTDCTRLIIY